MDTKNKLENKNVLKKIFLFLLVLAFIASILILGDLLFVKDKIRLNILSSSTFYAGESIEGLATINDIESLKEITSGTIKLQLYDSDGKKVKDVKDKIKITDNYSNLSLKLPNELEEGTYTLKAVAKNGIRKDVKNYTIQIASNADKKIVVSFDKGIYKPGDTINYRALLLNDTNYNPEEKTNVNVSIFDGNDNKVYTKDIQTDEYGVIFGEFTLGDEVNSGTYKVTVQTGATIVNKNIIVNPYVKPQYEVNITTDKESYVIGEKAKIVLNAKYFFGEPVVNANVNIKVNDENFVGITDSNGNLEKTVDVKANGVNTISANVVDSSNYYIESEKTFVGATDKFEIEIIPEYGDLIKGVDNTLYITTKTASGEPVKTYSYIQIGTLKREVITDENGVGKIDLSKDDIDKFNYSTTYIKKSNSTFSTADTYDYESDYSKKINATVIAETTDKTRVEKNIEIPFKIDISDVISTEKNKYNFDEEIKVVLNNSTAKDKCIGVYKGKQLLKLINTDSNEINLDLENVTGLVDIYVNTLDKFRISNTTKKSIFIIPNKELKLEISTDKEEYLPKDELNLKIASTSENDEKVDSENLISILDKSVLELADNDLSIDNIQLALSDIEISDGMTAADLYASVLNESNDGTLDLLLAKQNLTRTPLQMLGSEYHYDKFENVEKLILTFSIVYIVVTYIVIVSTSKNEKIVFVKKATKTIIAIAFISLLIGICFANSIIDLLYYSFEKPLYTSIISILVCIVIATIIYNFFLYKEKDLIIEGLIIVLSGIIGCFTAYILINLLSGKVIIIILLILLALYSILYRKKSKLLNNKKCKTFIKKWIGRIIYGAVLLILFAILYEITYSEWISVLAICLIYYLYDKIILQNYKIKLKSGKIILNTNRYELIGTIFGILLVLSVIGILSITSTFSSHVEPVRDDTINLNEYKGSSISGVSFSNPESYVAFDGAASTSSASQSKSNAVTSVISDIAGMFDTTTITNSMATSDVTLEENVEKEQVTNEEIKSDLEKEKNVRNVFLDSLAFIPNSRTENGTSNVKIPISDNITTWKIQIVGNTKDGAIGYSSKEFKVFKDYFIDFSLPTNSVVSDKVSIPVTLYNYTDSELKISLNVINNDWCIIGEYEKAITVDSKSNKMIYIPIEILKSGENKLRIETSAGEFSDIVEKTLNVSENAFEKTEIASSGTVSDKLSQDIIFNDEKMIDGSGKIKVSLYPNMTSQALDGIDEFLKMPSGCFEQTSSSLYPDILILKYLKNNNITNQEIENKANKYISAGYQKLLTYEVKGEKGGYSLYGSNPAEVVITAFGLMEMKEMSEVYPVDQKVIDNMVEYIFKNQNSNGSFDFNSTYIGNMQNSSDLAVNAYVVWALSETIPDDSRLNKSINYLKNKIDMNDVKTDNYTKALYANILANLNDKEAKSVVSNLVKNLNNSSNQKYVSTTTCDYWGTTGRYQNIQATALTSMALSKLDTNNNENAELIDYLMSNKSKTLWGTTQGSILALKAINSYMESSTFKDQIISLNVNDNKTDIKIEEDILSTYDYDFASNGKENHIEASIKKGKLNYTIKKQYLISYQDAEKEYKDNGSKIELSETINTSVRVNELITQNIAYKNNGEMILNGIIRINIPQGCTVIEDSLLQLVHLDKIEKYEYNYNTIDIYLRNISRLEADNIEIQYRASYPENVTGGLVRMYDYYNPDRESIIAPVNIEVNQ